MQTQKFPEDIQCILEPTRGIGGIFISNIEAAQNPATLQKHGIGAVITAVKGKNLEKVIPPHIEYLYIPAVDHESFDISYYFDVANNLIEEERKRTNVLVHCMAGISRSVTLVIAYLMKCCGHSYAQAYDFVKSRRSIIHPNDSFLNQLQKYQKQLRQPLTATKQSGNQSLSSTGFSKATTGFVKTTTDFTKTTQTKLYPSKENGPIVEQSSYDVSLRENIKSLFRQKSVANSRVL